MKYILFFTVLLISTFASAEESGWISPDGAPVENTESMKSIDGFGGWLVVTPDIDWWEKWNTPHDTVPYFSEAKEVRLGQQLMVLSFFGNPKTDASGMIDILCDIKVIRPDGSKSVDVANAECAKGELQGDRRSVRLTQALIKYVGEAGDPPGLWIVEITIKDNVANIAIPLKTSFVLLDSKANKKR